jgi:hypothetical protein
MSYQSLGGIQKVLAQITDPWDWAAAAAGASVGFVVSAHMFGLEGGVSIPGGASAAIALRKAAVASRQRPRILKKARGLVEVIEDRIGVVRSRIGARATQSNKNSNDSILAPPEPADIHDLAFMEELADLKARAQLEIELWKSDKTPKANEHLLTKLDALEDELRGLFAARMPLSPAKAGGKLYRPAAPER